MLKRPSRDEFVLGWYGPTTTYGEVPMDIEQIKSQVIEAAHVVVTKDETSRGVTVQRSARTSKSALIDFGSMVLLWTQHPVLWSTVEEDELVIMDLSREAMRDPNVEIVNADDPNFAVCKRGVELVAVPRNRLGCLATLLDAATEVNWHYPKPPNQILIAHPILDEHEVFAIRDLRAILGHRVDRVYEWLAGLHNHLLSGSERVSASIPGFGFSVTFNDPKGSTSKVEFYRGFQIIMDPDTFGPEQDMAAVPMLPHSVKRCCGTFERQICPKIRVRGQPDMALWTMKTLIDLILDYEVSMFRVVAEREVSTVMRTDLIWGKEAVEWYQKHLKRDPPTSNPIRYTG